MSQRRTPVGTDTLERTRYFPRQVVTPPDLSQDREYLLHKLRRHHRLLHGWGIVLGLEVEPIPPSNGDEAAKEKYEQFVQDTRMPDDVDPTCNHWRVVKPGYAISPRGDELYLPRAVFVSTLEEQDNALVVKPSACSTHSNPRTVKRTGDYYLIVESTEIETRPVRAAGARCGDHPDQFEYSRLRDGARFRLIEAPSRPDQVPPVLKPYPSDLEKLTGDPEFDHVVLAKLTLENGVVKSANTTNGSRSVWQFAGPVPPVVSSPPPVVSPPPPVVVVPPPPVVPTPHKNWLARLWGWVRALFARFWKWMK